MIFTLAAHNDLLTHTDSVQMGEAETIFRRTYPAFDATSLLDELRAMEYSCLDEQGHTYLDYTGAGLYAGCQIREQQKMAMDEYLATLGLQSAGAGRVSLGMVSNFAEAYRFAQVAETFLDTMPIESDLSTRMHC